MERMISSSWNREIIMAKENWNIEIVFDVPDRMKTFLAFSF